MERILVEFKDSRLDFAIFFLSKSDCIEVLMVLSVPFMSFRPTVNWLCLGVLIESSNLTTQHLLTPLSYLVSSMLRMEKTSIVEWVWHFALVSVAGLYSRTSHIEVMAYCGQGSSSALALSSRIKRVFYMSSEGQNLLHEVNDTW